MNVLAGAWAPPPSLTLFARKVDENNGEGREGYVHAAYAMALFATAERLRANVSSERLKLEAARSVIAVFKPMVERLWRQQGHTLNWSSSDYDRMARTMADEFTCHPWVRFAVERGLKERRDAVFSNKLLTNGNELFVIFSVERQDEQDEVMLEAPMATINRVLDYIEELKGLEEYKASIPLRRVLTCMARVHALVVA